MNKLIFVTLNTMQNDGGGTIRIKSLFTYSKDLRNSILVSNSSDLKFVENEVVLGVVFSTKEKRLFQFLVTFFPISLVKRVFFKKLSHIERVFVDNLEHINGDYVFCEYLDNSVGYYLKKSGIINGYVNDLHGIATNEFANQQSGLGLWNRFKYYVAKKHDAKILAEANGHIFSTVAMKSFFYAKYPKFRSKDVFYIPYLLDAKSLDSVINYDYYHAIFREFKLEKFSHIIFYAGAYKEIGGVTDLIEAFSSVLAKFPDAGLVLVGGGRCQGLVDKKISQLRLSTQVVQLGYRPHESLYTLQQLADVIVCPDRDNLYSNLIVHLKYFDSVASEKPVICGSFDSVNEIAGAEQLSLPYTPSDLDSLANAITYALINKEAILPLLVGYRQLVKDRFTYDSYKDTICSITY